MLLTLFIILALTLLVMVFIGITSSECSNAISSTAYGVVILVVSIITFISAVFATIELQSPTAIDVYRGNTTLEITYKNGVAIDSTVVFK